MKASCSNGRGTFSPEMPFLIYETETELSPTVPLYWRQAARAVMGVIDAMCGVVDVSVG